MTDRVLTPEAFAQTCAEHVRRTYPAPREKAAVRCGLGDVSGMCDRIAEDILASHTVRGRVTKLGAQLANVARRCGDAAWHMRDGVHPHEADLCTPDDGARP